MLVQLEKTINSATTESRKRKANFENEVPPGYVVLCIVSKRSPGQGVGISLEEVLVVDELTHGGTMCAEPTTVTTV
jgi:hypothetical protein